MVSVIIPCYNASRTIARSVESALQQTNVAVEVIVVDDGSEDVCDTVAVLERLDMSRITVLRLPHNIGQTAATNAGIRAAAGDLIALLDSDDRWHPEKLSKQVAAYKARSNEKTVVFTQSVVTTVDRGTARISVFPERGILAGERVTDYLFCERGFMQSSGLLLARRVALRVPLREGLRRHTDYDFLLALERHGCEFLFVPEPLVEIDWTTAHLRRRRRSMEPSFHFLALHRDAFGDAARTRFVFRQLLLPLIRDKGPIEELRRALALVAIQHVSLSDGLMLASTLIWGDERALRWASNLRRTILQSYKRVFEGSRRSET